MAKNLNLTVRELEKRDISLIADYWLKSDPDFLVAMGVDLDKLPTREGLSAMLTEQINLPDYEKQSFALIWELENEAVGHCNVNNITFGREATMHLHLWETGHRQKGLGTQLVRMSLPWFFDRLQIRTLWCEPYALNPAPNKTLEKIGFEFVRIYRTIPGSLNFEQEVNRWKLTRAKFLLLR